MSNTQGQLLVSGASGQLGRRVVELLLESDRLKGRKIIALTRSPEKLQDFTKRGVDVRSADFEQLSPLTAAFSGAERALIISTDALDRPGRRLEQHRAALRAAKAAGVAHVVYTSLTNPGPESLVSIAPDHWLTEESIRASGLGYTVLRNNMYTDHLLGGLPHAVQAGKLSNAFGNGAVSYVTREDCARAAAAALLADSTGNAVLDVTGPSAVTQAELAALCSELTGRPVAYLTVDAATSTGHLVAAGLPLPVAQLLTSFEVSGAKGQLAAVGSAVQALTGKGATSVREFLTANRTALG